MIFLSWETPRFLWAFCPHVQLVDLFISHKQYFLFLPFYFFWHVSTKELCRYVGTLSLATLTSSSRPRQRVGRLRAKRETRGSLHMLLGVQRMWGDEHSHSQVNSHVGSWSPKWTPESSKRDCRGQNSSPGKVIYIIGKLLKRKCLKWARMAHLNIWSYGQKKGWESNWQFDSRPLKVKNRPDSLVCRQRATYHWKALDKSYNFASDFVAIEGLHRKLCTFKVARIPIMPISGLQLGSPGTKKPFRCGSHGEVQSIL
jgi:hypothetical protein